jgi:hypothetical protein
VTGTANTSVTWTVQEGAAGGAVSSTGLYGAPSAAGSYHVSATSVADPTRSASSTETVTASGGTGGVDPTGLIPAERTVPWNPGLNAVGGIPNRTAVCATLSPGGGDDTSAIQNALNACPTDGVVKLSAGTFKISGQGLVVPSHRVLRGSGPTATRLVKAAGSSYTVIDVGPRWATDNDSKYSATNLASDAVKGTNTVTLASSPGLAVGELVLLDELTDTNLTNWGGRTASGMRGWFSRTDRPVSQVMEVASVSGTTVTFTTTFHGSYRVSQGGQLSRYTAGAASTYAGVEDLYVSGGEGGDGGGNIHFFHAAYSWVRNVESDQNRGTSVNLDGAFRCVIRDSYVHTALNPSPGGDGYLLGLNRGAADNLVENNAVWNGNKVIVMRASGGGNVVGYNYMDDAWGSGYPTIPEVGLNAAHMTTPHHELFEGNESFNFDGDSVWGNSIYITVYRNHLTAKRRSISPLALTDAQNRRAVGLTLWHWWYSFLGNVLGTPDIYGNTNYVYERSTFNTDTPVPMWKLGYDGSNGSAPQDQTVVQRTLRHGNFDYVTNGVRWDPTVVRHDLPASLYLTAKPAFFGSSPWPWVTPETPATPLWTLPARARFDALHGL